MILMAKKTLFAVILIIFGVSIGSLVIFAYSMSGGKTSIALPFLAMAILCIITGTILAFSRLLDRIITPVVDELHKDIEDDLQDLKEYRISNTVWMLIITGIAGVSFSFFVFRLHKLEAMWGAIPVAIPTIIGMAALAWFVPRTRWFQNYREYTPMGIFMIPTIGLIITLGLGLSEAENLDVMQVSRGEAVEYNTPPSTLYFIQSAADVGDIGFSLAIPDCDGDACVVLLVIVLVILVFILVVGSALIPHFWMLSGSLLLGIMMLIAIHDLRIRREMRRSKSNE